MGIGILDGVAGVVGQVIERVWPDPAQQAAAKLQLMQLQQTGELAAITGQMDINKVEAGNQSLFVSGGRPFIIWICGFAFGWNWIGLPMTKAVMTVLGHPIVLQAADMSEMMPVLMGLLGLGGLHAWENVKKSGN
jgi:Holin of 3TMs, for gene-transfer release